MCGELSAINFPVTLSDAEYEFVGMGNRHIPTKCISLGTWDHPGERSCLEIYS